MRQRPISKEIQEQTKQGHEVIYQKLRTTFSGTHLESIPRRMMVDSEEQREAMFQELWDQGGFHFWSMFERYWRSV